MVFHLYTQLSDVLVPAQFQLLLVLLTRLLPLIEKQLVHRENPSGLLSTTVSEFLAQSLHVDISVITRSWEILRPHRNSLGQNVDYQKLADDLFRLYGPKYELAAEALYPPVNRCARSKCQGRGTLGQAQTIQCTLYTLHRGAVPITSTSLYCSGCLTRYHPNYHVHHPSGSHPKRVYYHGIPEYIHVTTHVYVERALCSFFEIEMAISQVSASNIATVYNYATAPSASPIRPIHQPLHLLSSRIVLDAFFLHSLLRDKQKDGERLFLPHDGPHEHRFDNALKERNDKIRKRGQEMWGHACDDCHKRLRRPDGTLTYLSAGVTDGVTVGHPCCSVLNCQDPLEKGRDRYCHKHRTLNEVCAVENCSGRTTRGFLTCVDPAHRTWEARRRRRKRTTGAAYTILSERYQRAASKYASTVLPTDDSTQHPGENEEALPSATESSEASYSPGSPCSINIDNFASPSSESSSPSIDYSSTPADFLDPGNAPDSAPSSRSTSMPATTAAFASSQSIPTSAGPSGLPANDAQPSTPRASRRSKKREGPSSPPVESFKGHIYRRWTHNEQLFVCCCGIILSRATFFGSEGILGVTQFLKGTFPPQYPGYLFCIIFYDNNCNLRKSLQARQDHYFDNVGMPVDVFHAVHKHNAEDAYCQRHCNPWAFPDLQTCEGEWVFNSSVAEQVNRWFGGFQRLVREMAPVRYHFYLDEAIAIRNRIHAERLYQDGKNPHIIPDTILTAPVCRSSV